MTLTFTQVICPHCNCCVATHCSDDNFAQCVTLATRQPGPVHYVIGRLSGTALKLYCSPITMPIRAGQGQQCTEQWEDVTCDECKAVYDRIRARSAARLAYEAGLDSGLDWPGD